jgi:hypothetical protein
MLTSVAKRDLTAEILDCNAKAHEENPSYAVQELVRDWAFDFLPANFQAVGSGREAKGNN